MRKEMMCSFSGVLIFPGGIHSLTEHHKKESRKQIEDGISRVKDQAGGMAQVVDRLPSKN
jgi:hypothetical protein